MKGLTKIKGISPDEIKEVLSKEKVKFYTKSVCLEADKYCPLHDGVQGLDSKIIAETHAESIVDKFFPNYSAAYLRHNYWCYSYEAVYKPDSFDFIKEIPIKKGRGAVLIRTNSKGEIVQYTTLIFKPQK